MKIGLLTSKRAEQQFSELFEAIIVHLEKKGHEVVHHMQTPLEVILPLSYPQRQELFMKFYEKLEECDIIFAETSLQSTQVGFGLAHLRMKGRPVVILSQGDIANMHFPKGEVYSSIENTMAFQYSKTNISEVLDEALAMMEPHLDKRFTIIFPAHLMAQVEEEAQRRHLPKAVYIRQLIEEDFRKQVN